MRDSQQHHRLSGGFSLDEASRLYRRSAVGVRLECPMCGGQMRDSLGGSPHGAVRMLRCDDCGRGVMLDGPSSEGSG